MRQIISIIIFISFFSCHKNEPYGKNQELIISEVFSPIEWIDSLKKYNLGKDSIISILDDINGFNKELFEASGGITENFNLYSPYNQLVEEKKKIYDKFQLSERISNKIRYVSNMRIRKSLILFFDGNNSLFTFKNIEDKTPIEIIRMLNSLSLFVILELQNQEVRRVIPNYGADSKEIGK